MFQKTSQKRGPLTRNYLALDDIGVEGAADEWVVVV